MNWEELKEFCNNLDKSQLEKKVVLWREYEAITDIYAQQLDENRYYYEDSEGCVPESEVKTMLEDKDEFPNGMADFKKVYDKGDPILYEEF